MKMLKSLLTVIALSTVVLASTQLNAQSNEFEKEMPEYDQKPITNNDIATIHERIQKDMDIACVGNLCTAASKNTHSRGWSVEFNLGEGSGNGFYGSGGGTVIVGDANINSREYWGVTVRYENTKCNSVIQMDKSFFRTMKLYAETMVNEDGTPKRTFYPSEQTTILLYTTIMNNVESCRSGNGSSGR
ncbi:MAG: hypothetical protein V4596_02800 [Bdellovibrionota bacterium]